MICLTLTFSLPLVSLEKSLPFPWTPLDSKGRPCGPKDPCKSKGSPILSGCLEKSTLVNEDEDYNGCKDSLKTFPSQPILSLAVL